VPIAKAKYLNSPETPLFHKSRFCIISRAPAKPLMTPIRVDSKAIWMSSACRARGHNNAVAGLGTAMTEEQIRLAWRMAPEPMMCLDGDAGGFARRLSRALTALLPLLKPGYSLRFAILPPGKDPDDVVRDGGRRPCRRLSAKR
jgi:DNA primase